MTALQLPGLENTHYLARGCFVMCLILSFMSVFFSGLQQASFGQQMETNDLRLWLASGWYMNEKSQAMELRSSSVAHMILEAPFEVVIMSITLFTVGMGTYLGSSWERDLPLSTGSQGNRAVLIAFLISTIFVLVMYGHMLGYKDLELIKTANARRASSIAYQPALAKAVSDSEACTENGSVKGDDIGEQVNNIDLSALRKALEVAADAQRKCAQANIEIVKQYESVLRSNPYGIRKRSTM